ncbi:putative thioredoxin [Kineosphaera limosa]|nr:tetratricopeptide repeat protein [Kineosphaera limosa]NYD99558.1 putative thioredoxin [Kineosphaera limosa]
MPRSAMRGAVDLSGIGQAPSAPPASGGSSTGFAGGVRVDATEAEFQDVVMSTRDVAALVVLWSAAHPETEQAVTNAVTVAERQDGRLRVVAVDVQANPGIAAAFQVQQIPMTVGLVAGQPVPLFPGVQPAEQLAPVVAELLKVAAQNGVTGHITDAGQVEAPDEPEIDPRFEAAFDAVEAGDYDTAIAAYEQVLKEAPADDDAKAGLAQVKLLKRVADADLAAARAEAAAKPTDVAAQTLAADLDLAGGHVEDAFTRLVDLVRATAEEERDAARAHLLELFEIVGPKDERVVKARRALMSALF